MLDIGNFLLEDSLRPQILQRLAHLEAVVSFIEARLSKAPRGSVRTALNPGRAPQHYLVTDPGDTNGKYIHKSDLSLAAAIIQRDYDRKAVKLLQKEISLLKKTLKSYTPDAVKVLFDRLRPGRKQLTSPVTLAQSDFALQWISIPYKHKDFLPDTPELYTSGGLRVRSKSEILIAEALDKMNVPYRYEYPVKFKNTGSSESFTVHPDFFCLNLRTGKEFIWEHLGLLEDPVYARNAVKKMTCYQKSGYFPGVNLIITTESTEFPANSKSFIEVIKKYLI